MKMKMIMRIDTYIHTYVYVCICIYLRGNFERGLSMSFYQPAPDALMSASGKARSPGGGFAAWLSLSGAQIPYSSY